MLSCPALSLGGMASKRGDRRHAGEVQAGCRLASVVRQDRAPGGARGREYADFRVSSDGEVQGVGLLIGASNGRLLVVAPILGGPADRAGVLPGDEARARPPSLSPTLPPCATLRALAGGHRSGPRACRPRPGDRELLARDSAEAPTCTGRRTSPCGSQISGY